MDDETKKTLMASSGRSYVVVVRFLIFWVRSFSACVLYLSLARLAGFFFRFLAVMLCVSNGIMIFALAARFASLCSFGVVYLRFSYHPLFPLF
jgi:hypothetical protein